MNLFDGIVSIKLLKSYKYNGDVIDSLNLDFSLVTGRVTMQAEKKAFQSGNMAVVKTLNSEYCAYVATVITGMGETFIEKLAGQDFEMVTQTVAAYFGNKNPEWFYKQYRGDYDGSEEDFLESHQADHLKA